MKQDNAAGMHAPADTTRTNPQQGSVRDVKVGVKRKVTYVFNTKATSTTLSIPYALAVDDTVVQGVTKPARLTHKKKVTAIVDPGSEVSLYLNSDAHPSFRSQPVYKITANERDVLVTVTEKTGKSSDSDTPAFVSTEGKPGAQVDNYSAPLTGDIWMKVSHKYSKADAEALLPADGDAGVRDAVLDVYAGLSSSTLGINCSEPAGHVVSVKFNDSDNPKNNINSYELKNDGLTRVHPLGLYALFDAARQAACTSMTMSSCWRPLLGSIAHRAGLGLDVSYLEDSSHKVQLNRKELRGGSPDVTWVSAEEKRLFGEYEKARKAAVTAATGLKAAEASLKKARQDPAQVVEATKARDAAREKKAAADKAHSEAKQAWNTERDAHEPAGLRSFRTALEANIHVSQVFDPWFMDANTRDNVPHAANEQISGNEKLHAHHLHITVKESKIL